jgi:hypothetical protein
MVSHLYTSGNNGFLFKMDSEVIYREHIYASSRYSDSILHPALNVTFMNPAAIKNLGNTPKLVLSPNPSHNVLGVTNFADEQSAVKISVYNTLGQRVYVHSNFLNVGSNEISIPTADWVNGLYIFEMQSESWRIRQNFIKE